MKIETILELMLADINDEYINETRQQYKMLLENTDLDLNQVFPKEEVISLLNIARQSFDMGLNCLAEACEEPIIGALYQQKYNVFVKRKKQFNKNIDTLVSMVNSETN